MKSTPAVSPPLPLSREGRGEITEIYPVGIWTVKPGREEEFVAAWRAMGEATIAEFPAAHGRLLRDVDNPGRFVSFRVPTRNKCGSGGTEDCLDDEQASRVREVTLPQSPA